jgi:hypothetical protein
MNADTPSPGDTDATGDTTDDDAQHADGADEDWYLTPPDDDRRVTADVTVTLEHDDVLEKVARRVAHADAPDRGGVRDHLYEWVQFETAFRTRDGEDAVGAVLERVAELRGETTGGSGGEGER